LQFTGAHVLRAVDVVDIIDEYQLDIQNVKHNSTLAGLLLVALHLAVDVFVLYWVVRGANGLWGWMVRRLSNGKAKAAAASGSVFKEQATARKVGRVLRALQLICALICLATVVGCAWNQGWHGWDWLLWP